MIAKHHSIRVLYAFAGIYAVFALILSLVRGYLSWIDSALYLILLIVLYREDARVLPLWIYFMGLTCVIIANSIPFGIYSFFPFNSIIGVDKYLHFLNAFFLTIVVFWYAHHYLRTNNTPLSAFQIIVISLVFPLGIGALIEINEFVGSTYFGVTSNIDTHTVQYVSIFTTHDTLPETRSELQLYDTYFDLIFQLFGELAALVTGFLTIRRKDL